MYPVTAQRKRTAPVPLYAPDPKSIKDRRRGTNAEQQAKLQAKHEQDKELAAVAASELQATFFGGSQQCEQVQLIEGREDSPPRTPQVRTRERRSTACTAACVRFNCVQ